MMVRNGINRPVTGAVTRRSLMIRSRGSGADHPADACSAGSVTV
jgi:hypothetical protein